MRYSKRLRLFTCFMFALIMMTGGIIGAADKPYKFALVAPLTGDSAQYGLAYKNACEILVNKVNASGGINGAPVVLGIYDDKRDPKETLNIANKLIADPELLGVVGSQTSSCSMAAAPVFQKAGVIMISPQASHPDFTLLGDYIFRIIQTAAAENAQYADFLVKNQGKKRIAIIHSNDDWGVSVKDALVERSKQIGGNIVSVEKFIASQTKDFTPLISKIKMSNPDALYLATLYSDAALILQQARDLKLNVTFYGTNTLQKQEFLDLTGANAEGLIILNSFVPDNPDPKFQSFKKEYEATTKSMVDAYATQSYDALSLLIDAAKKYGHDKKAMRDYIASIKDYPGVSGVFTFDENRNPQKDLYAFIVKNGAYVYFK